MDQQTYRNLVSGHTPGLPAILLRMLLTLLSWPYAFVIRLRNGLYSAGLFRAHHVNAVVISVGNLTAGGTGKTPLVVWLCRAMRQRRWPCAILTRGYKAQRGELSDEPAVLAAKCPDVSIVVNPDRVAGAKQAVREHSAEVLLLDDGFQHRRLGRDVDIVTIDATVPFGYGRMLPAGLLREPITTLRRADAVVITRCDQVSEERLAQIEGQVRRINPELILATAIHAPINAATSGGAEIGLEELRGKRAYAFCGLGNPEAFFDTLRHIGCVLAGWRSLDDHCGYTSACLNEIRRQAEEHNVDYIVTTQKDWTKLAQIMPPDNGPRMVYLAIEMEFLTGSEQLIDLIDRAVDGKMSHLRRSGK